MTNNIHKYWISNLHEIIIYKYSLKWTPRRVVIPSQSQYRRPLMAWRRVIWRTHIQWKRNSQCHCHRFVHHIRCSTAAALPRSVRFAIDSINFSIVLHFCGPCRFHGVRESGGQSAYYAALDDTAETVSQE